MIQNRGAVERVLAQHVQNRASATPGRSAAQSRVCASEERAVIGAGDPGLRFAAPRRE